MSDPGFWQKNWTKFKGVTKQAFNADLKTRDEAFEKRTKFVQDLCQRVAEQHENVVSFIVDSGEMLAKTHSLGSTLRLCYEDSPYAGIMNQVENAMKDIGKLREENQTVGQRLRQAKNILDSDIKILQELVKKREDVRVYYDHYRSKLEDLRKAQRENKKAGLCDASKGRKLQEQIIRNQTKYQAQKRDFDAATHRCYDKIDEFVEKADKLLISMSIRFTKQIQINYYEKMHSIFKKMENLEQKMLEVPQFQTYDTSRSMRSEASQKPSEQYPSRRQTEDYRSNQTNTSRRSQPQTTIPIAATQEDNRERYAVFGFEEDTSSSQKQPARRPTEQAQAPIQRQRDPSPQLQRPQTNVSQQQPRQQQPQVQQDQRGLTYVERIFQQDQDAKRREEEEIIQRHQEEKLAQQNQYFSYLSNKGGQSSLPPSHYPSQQPQNDYDQYFSEQPEFNNDYNFQQQEQYDPHYQEAAQQNVGYDYQEQYGGQDQYFYQQPQQQDNQNQQQQNPGQQYQQNYADEYF